MDPYTVLLIVLFLIAVVVILIGLRLRPRERCPGCQRWTSVKWRICPYCGYILSEEEEALLYTSQEHSEASGLVRSLCPHCWEPLQQGDQFCGRCGGKVARGQKRWQEER